MNAFMSSLQALSKGRRLPRPVEPQQRRAMRLQRRFDAEAERLRQARGQAIGIFLRDLGRLSTRQRNSQYRRLWELSFRQQVLASLDPGVVRPSHQVLVSSWTLLESFRVCTETPDEGMHFVVGAEVDGVWVGTNIVKFPYAERSPVGAAGDPRATHGAVIEAAESGHRILLIAHSHPGSGPNANFPSSTDLRTHRLWEQGTPLAGAIWSRDGYVRFFTAGRAVSVGVLGTHLEQVDGQLWKLREEFMSHAD